MLEINEDNYEALVAEGKPMVIDFSATWCGPCKRVAPILDGLAKEYEGQVVVGKCDIEENDDLVAKFGVRNVPTILFIKGGEVVDKQVGLVAKSVFEEKLKALL
jgi:thioredoxin 1